MRIMHNQYIYRNYLKIGNKNMDEFLEDLTSGDIQFRDRWQFELKSDFYLKPTPQASNYGQEFYFFIPNALQINSSTYSKEDFYRDLTHFIRYKTPEFTLEELISKTNELSPFFRLSCLLATEESRETIEQAEIEIKLLGNILRSSVRNRVASLLQPRLSEEKLNTNCLLFCHEIQKVRKAIDELQKQLLSHFINEKLRITCGYLDEFISNTLDYYLTGLLAQLRKKSPAISEESDFAICEQIIFEKTHREAIHHLAIHTEERKDKREEILYRSGLLKKFIMDALMLPTSRESVQERYGHYIGSFSAGIAMLLYILLFIWQGQWFIINSAPFIIITVVAYILKDRIKEGLKTLSYQRALRWFSDYATEIRSSDEKNILGILRESFTFVNEENIPQEIRLVRNREFHAILETYKRPEQVIYFKHNIIMYAPATTKKQRFNALSATLRFNIQDFLTKASDPYHSYMTLDPETKTLLHMRLPKIYHLNIILKNTYTNENQEVVSELKKFRIILDKNGIKEIEQVRGSYERQ